MCRSALAVKSELRVAIDEAAKRFAELAEKFDPKVVEATLGAARIEAFSWLASSALWFGGAAALAFLLAFLGYKVE